MNSRCSCEFLAAIIIGAPMVMHQHGGSIQNSTKLHEKLRQMYRTDLKIDLFTVVCLVTWPLNESEAGTDLDMIQTSLLLLC